MSPQTLKSPETRVPWLSTNRSSACRRKTGDKHGPPIAASRFQAHQTGVTYYELQGPPAQQEALKHPGDYWSLREFSVQVFTQECTSLRKIQNQGIQF